MADRKNCNCKNCRRRNRGQARCYTKQDFAEEVKKLTGGAGVDYVIDGEGKTTFTKNLDALKPRGSATVFGMASGPADPLVPSSLMMKSLTISSGAFANYTATRDDLLRRARDVFAALREGWLKAARRSDVSAGAGGGSAPAP